MTKKIISSIVFVTIALFTIVVFAAPARNPAREAVTGYAGGTLTSPILAPDGAVGAPSYSYSADTDLGFYRVGTNIIGIAAGGALQASFDTTGMEIKSSLALDADALWCISPTTDVAPTDAIIHAAHAYAQGTQTASNLYLSAGADEKYITVTNYAVGSADTVAVTIDGTGIVRTEGTHWDCITSNAVCATNLAVALNALTGISAEAVAAVVYITLDAGATSAFSSVTADGAADGIFGTSTNGTDGDIVIGGTKVTMSPNDSILNWIVGSQLSSPSDGNVLATDAAGTDFGLLQLGGTTSSYPAIKRSGTGLVSRLADDSADAPLTASILAASSSINVNGQLTADTDALWCVAPVTDVAPTDVIIHSAHAYAQGTQTASDLFLAGGADEKYITVTDYTVASADTVTVTINGADTIRTETTHWACITSNDVCATNLAADLTALTGISATAVGAVVYITPLSGATYSFSSVTADGAADGIFGTSTNGTDGDVYANNNLVTSGDITIGGALEFESGTILDDPADAKLTITDNGITKGICIDASTDALLKLYDDNCSTAASMKFFDNAGIILGGGNDVLLRWSTVQTNDMFLIGTDSSRTALLLDASDVNVDFGYPNGATTTFMIQSGDHTQLTEWISFTHDATNGVIDVGEGVIEFKDDIILKSFTKHHDMQIGAAIFGAAAPTVTTIGTFRCPIFDANADEAYLNQELPSDWDGASDMAIRMIFFTESGDALANGEIIEFDVEYRSVKTTAPGEAYDNGTSVTVHPTITGGASEVDKGSYAIETTIPYNTGDQPLAVHDTVGFFIIRDVNVTDTYSGDVMLCRVELVYTANKPSEH